MMKRVLVISVALLFGLQAGFALAAATGNPAPLTRFAANAPTATAGQNRPPRSSSATSAMPLGAQTGVITPCAIDRLIPNRAQAR